jgi:hypothetical protein
MESCRPSRPSRPKLNSGAGFVDALAIDQPRPRSSSLRGKLCTLSGRPAPCRCFHRRTASHCRGSELGARWEWHKADMLACPTRMLDGRALVTARRTASALP